MPKWALFGKRGSGARTYWLLDRFSTNQAAPLTSPRTCEPGPGTLTIVDAGNRLSISGSELVAASGPGSWTDCGLYEPNGIARAAGRALAFKINHGATTTISRIGWKSAAAVEAGNWVAGPYFYQGSIQVTAGINIPEVGTYAAATDYEVMSVLRASGHFLLIKGGAYADWTLLWVDRNLTTATVYAGFNNFDGARELDDLRATDLGSPWDTEFGLATDRLVGARADGDDYTHTADGLVEFVVTALPTSGSIRLQFRKADNANFWEVEVNAAGDLKLNEYVANVGTNRGTSAAVVAANDRIVISFRNEQIQVYEASVRRINYTSAANFKTATVGELWTVGTGGGVSDIVAWPSNVGSQIPAGV